MLPAWEMVVLDAMSKQPNPKGELISLQNVRAFFFEGKIYIQDNNYPDKPIIELFQGDLEYKDVKVYCLLFGDVLSYEGLFALVSTTESTMYGIMAEFIPDAMIKSFIKWLEEKYFPPTFEFE